MAAAVNDNEELVAEINVTPFIDVVLVLLVVLMVTSTAIVKAALKVDLPKAASAGAAVESTLNVVLTQDGALFLDGAAVSEGELTAAVARERQGKSELLAVLAADQGVPYGQVIRVIDAIKRHGVTSFALNLERAADAP